MATKGTKYYNMQVQLEKMLEVVMSEQDASLLQAHIIIRDVLSDAVDFEREKLSR